MKKLSLWAGPTLLLFTFLLMLSKAAPAIGRPVWLTALTLSALVSGLITYLSLKERDSTLASAHVLIKEREDDALRLQNTLEDAKGIYREKIDQLEESLIAMEGEQFDVKVEREKLFAELNLAKQREGEFQASLQEALNELRSTRQLHYLHVEGQAQIPKDLVHQHSQLREQFDEKATVLNQTRRRLFQMEGELFTLQRELNALPHTERDEQKKLVELLNQLTEENERLEREVYALEEIVTSALAKKKSSKKASAEVQEELQLF